MQIPELLFGSLILLKEGELLLLIKIQLLLQLQNLALD